jgi:hypothetical protein
VLGLAGYLLLAVILLGKTWFGGGGLEHRLVGGGTDPLGLVWFLAWLPHALAHGHSPLFTSVLMAPQGANLLNSASILLPSLLLWPITSIFGPIPSYDILATLALALSAWAAYFALRRITPHRSSAWIGGLIYGFGGYMVGQATAHVNLMITVFPPIAAMLVDDVRRTRSPVRTGALLGLCSAAQVFVDEEILATTTIMILLGLLVAGCIRRPGRAVVMRYALAGTVTGLVFTVLAGPALVYELFGPQHVHGLFVSSGRYVNDVAGFVVPNSVQWLTTAGSRRLASGFSGFDGEYGAYLGAPLLALLSWAVWRLRRRALPASLLLTASVIFSLGPHLRVGGHDTGVWLPWIIPNHLPLLENAVPDRFNLYIWLAVAGLVVLLIDDLRKRPLLGRRYLGLVVCAIALIPALPALPPSEPISVPAVIGKASVFRRYAPGAKSALITPFSNGQFAMYAQAQSGFAYKIPVGGVFVPDADGAAYGMRHGPLLYALAELGGNASTHAGRTHADKACLAILTLEQPLNTTCRTHYLRALRALKVDVVIVTGNGRRRATDRYTRFFTSLLGPHTTVAGAKVYNIHTVY